MTKQVQKITIEDFKRIQKLEINLASITALVGGNTSGKSSALQAAQLFVSLLQASFNGFKRNGVPEFAGSLAMEDVTYRPTESLLDLRFGGNATQNSGFMIGIDCTDLGDGSSSEASLKVTRGKNANLALTRSGSDDLAAIIGNADNPFCVFSPGLSGIPRREEWKTRGALDATVMHGDANLYLRTVLDHLLRKDLEDDEIDVWWNEADWELLPAESDWRLFCELLDACYPGAKVFVDHDQRRDRYVHVEVEYKNETYPLDMASTGMLQVMQILAYACLYRPPLLLLDEPDAHLHADSQSRLYEALRGLTERTETRIVFATHSPQIIQLLTYDSAANVIWLDNGASVPLSTERRPALPMLMELGALSVGAEAFDTRIKSILLTEDTNSHAVQVFAAANGFKKFACLSYNGAPNLSGARQLARLLVDLRPDVRVIIHRDRDFRTSGEMAFEAGTFKQWCSVERIERVMEIFTPLNDIEHSFADPEHLKLVLKDKISSDKIDEVFQDVLQIARDEMTGRLRIARRAIDDSLYGSERQKAKPLWKEVGLPMKAPKHSEFLPASGKDSLQLEHCYGKDLLRRMTNRLNHEIKGPSDVVPGLILTASKALDCEAWCEAAK